MEEYISKQAAIDKLAEIIRYTDHDEPVVDWNDLVTVLCFLPSAQQWIPVNEGPPEKSGEYLVTVEDELTYLWFGVYKSEEKKWAYCHPFITAWMPLPEPYRPEGGAANV